MYTINGYGAMIADRTRMAAYEEAMRRSVKPGSVVLDLGAGTGIMSLLACQLGARRVHAVEPGNAIHVARESAAANGLTDRIVFHQDYSTNLSLPEPADVIVADLRGVVPLFPGNVAALADARWRLLAPHGTLIPRRDTLWAAVVEAPELYRQHSEVWRTFCYGFNMEAARRLVLNTWSKQYFQAEQLLTEPQQWAVLDYQACDDPNVAGKLQAPAVRAGTAHGLLVWFESELCDGVELTNRPGAPQMIYSQAFFPLANAVPVESGDRFSLGLQATLVLDDYVWRWETTVADGAGTEKARFKQASLFGEPLTPSGLRKRAPDHVPVLAAKGELDRFILSRMDGVQSLEAIARQTAAAFAAQFPTWLDALPRVGELSQKYGR